MKSDLKRKEQYKASQAKRREELRAQGYKPKQIWCTDDEHEQLMKVLEAMREEGVSTEKRKETLDELTQYSQDLGMYDD